MINLDPPNGNRKSTMPKSYAPAPQIPLNYSGPEIPLVYDQNWQLYRNLTDDQRAWFQAQPEWQDFLSFVALSPETASAAMSPAAVNAGISIARKSIA